MTRTFKLAILIAAVFAANVALTVALPARSSWGSSSCHINTSARLITVSTGCHARHVIVPRGTRVTYR